MNTPRASRPKIFTTCLCLVCAIFLSMGARKKLAFQISSKMTVDRSKKNFSGNSRTNDMQRPQSPQEKHFGGNSRSKDMQIPQFPQELIGTVYQPSDFQGEDGQSIPWWVPSRMGFNNTFMFDDNNDVKDEISSWGPCFPADHITNWTKNAVIKYGKKVDEVYSGLCRPGFLIIGAGKCGTSSLYQYLIGHDRVLPAKV